MSDSAFLILFLAFTAVMAVFPFLLRKVGIPTVISLLLVGMLVGPTGLDVIGVFSRLLRFLGSDPQTTANIFTQLVGSLGALGLVFLMALAGMEADFKLIRSARMPVIALSILTFVIPAATGYFVYWYFCPHDLPGKLLYASLFASHSVGIVFPVIREMKLSQTRFGAAVLISTVITDIASIVLLAVSVQLFRQNQQISHSVVSSTLSIFDHVDNSILGNSFTPVFLLVVLLYFVISIWLVNRSGKLLLKHLHPGEDLLITILLLVILCTVLAGEILGINLVVGAFIAGLGLSRVVQGSDKTLFRRFESIGYGFLIPFLFVSIGMKTDFSAFAGEGNLKLILMTVAGLVLSKVFSGYTAMRLTGFSRSEGLMAGLMTVPQLSATLAAAAIGKDLGMLSPQFFNTIIILSVVTTIPVPSVVRFIYLKFNMKERVHSRGEPLGEEETPPLVVQDEELL